MPEHTSFSAGAATRSITPDLARLTTTPPQFTRVRDDLFVRALVVENAGKVLAMVSLDIQNLGFARAMRARIHEESGIPMDAIFLWPSHAHCAPNNRELAYWERVNNEVALAVREARSALRPAELGFARGEAHLSMNKLAVIDGVGRCLHEVKPRWREFTEPVDPDLGLLSFREPGGKSIAFLYFYSAHPIHLINAGWVTAEFPGEVARRLEPELGAPLFFVNGAEGDLNMGIAQSDEQHMHESSAGMVEALRGLQPRLAWSRVLCLDWRWEVLDGGDHHKWRLGMLRLTPSLAFVNVPCELFSELGIEIKRRSPFTNTFITLGRSNAKEDGGTYVPGPRGLSIGAYGAESWRPAWWGELFVERAHALLQASFQELIEKGDPR